MGHYNSDYEYEHEKRKLRNCGICGSEHHNMGATYHDCVRHLNDRLKRLEKIFGETGLAKLAEKLGEEI